MIRAGWTAGALALAAGLAAPALAAEGGAIRGGEHDGFTRIVLTVDPTTEWSLETADGRATLRFPGRQLAFAADGVHDRIPRTRVKAVSVTPDPSGTVVTVDLGCDCRVSTSFVGARYLALDVADRDAAPAAVAPPPPPAETAEARGAREAKAVASAEEMLIRQIERAASQGIVRYSDPDQPPASGAEEAPAPVAGASAAEAPETLSGVLAALTGSDQIQATTVYDRDSRDALAANGTDEAAASACIEDARLDVGAWSNGLPLVAQTPELRRRLVAEFDVPDPAALRDLARLYLRFGFGAEAATLLAAFPEAAVEDRPLLVDLADAVEGREVTPGGPLAVDAACPGNHALWLALAGAAPVWRDDVTFASSQAAFAALPVDLRLLLGPRLIGRLLDAGRVAEARAILDVAARPGAPAGPELDLAAARVAAAEARPEEAMRALHALIGRDGHVSVEALAALTRIVLDAGLAIPDRIVTDLRAAALQHRGAPAEAELRRLLIEALAARAELPAALEETRRAMRDLPAAPGLGGLIVRLIAEADPAAVGPATWAETALAADDLLAATPPADPARVATANRLLALGLPDPALALVAPAVAAGEEAARLVAAEAELARGDAAAARSALGPLASPEASAIRARAFALSGAYAEAVSTLANNGMAAAALPYAWPSGDWPRARAAADDPTRAAMAGYMQGAAAAPPAPAADPAALTPELAFQEPLPPLDRPSLDAARRLIAAGGKIDALVEQALTEGSPAN